MFVWGSYNGKDKFSKFFQTEPLKIHRPSVNIACPIKLKKANVSKATG